ncbi:hypothetical protein OSTOST_21679 [Ostertagia ostertagi]
MEADGYPEYRRPNDGKDDRLLAAQRSITDLWFHIISIWHFAIMAILNYNTCRNLCTKVKIEQLFIWGEEGPDNEIDANINAGYVCAPESAHRILGFDLQSKSDTVYRLQVHLPEHEISGRQQEALHQVTERDTILTAYHELKRSMRQCTYRRFHHKARLVLEPYFTSSCQKHTRRKWNGRRRQDRHIGRVYSILTGRRTMQSEAPLFQQKRSQVIRLPQNCEWNFQGAAEALGPMHYDSYDESCLWKATEFRMPRVFGPCLVVVYASDPEHL